MDKDLDDLLDSALNDFDQKQSAPNKEEAVKKTSDVTVERTNLYVDDIDYEDRPVRSTLNASKTTSSTTGPTKSSYTASFSASETIADQNAFNINDDNMKLFEEIFNDEKTKESMKHFKEAFEVFQSGKDESALLKNFQKVMSDLANQDLDLDSFDDDEDFDNIEDFNFLKNLTGNSPTTTPKSSQTQNKSETDAKGQTTASIDAEKQNPLKKVLEDMNKNSEKILKNSSFPFGADFLSTLTNSLSEEAVGTDDADNLDGTSLMMQPILSMLFSKDILYPSLKLMLENYDKYIEEKRDKLNEAELKKCYDQKECIEKMCQIYEKSSESDSKESKAEQLKSILDLLEKCGMPPQELVPDVNPFESFGDQFKGSGCPIS